MQSEPRYKKGTMIGGRYWVYQVLMGGMGEVYFCLDAEAKMPLAFKTFQQRVMGNIGLIKAFREETAIGVRLEKHPNIVRCRQVDFVGRQPFLFLEWIAGDEQRGTSLRDWLRRGALDLRLALTFGLDICHGLIHAQAKQPGLVHGDLKPENILMAQGGWPRSPTLAWPRLCRRLGWRSTPPTPLTAVTAWWARGDCRDAGLHGSGAVAG